MHRCCVIVVIPVEISLLNTLSFLNRPALLYLWCKIQEGDEVYSLEKANRPVATISFVPNRRTRFCGNMDRRSPSSFHPRNRADQPRAVHGENGIFCRWNEHRLRLFRTIALLMPKGWSRFKRELYTRSVDHYRCRSTVPAAAGSLGRTYISPWCTFVLMRSQR